MAPFAGMQVGSQASQQQAPIDPCVDAISGSYDSSEKLNITLKPVPDINSQRWCRACEALLPVCAFPTGKRRYLCRKHLWQRCTRPCKQRKLSEIKHRHVHRIWRRCWDDAKLSFGQKGITLVQKHIEEMLQSWKDGNQNVKSAANLDRSCGYVLQNFSDCAAIVPVDPEKMLSPSNAFVVDMPGRTVLLRACKTGGTKQYAQELAAMSGALKACAGRTGELETTLVL